MYILRKTNGFLMLNLFNIMRFLCFICNVIYDCKNNSK